LEGPEALFIPGTGPLGAIATGALCAAARCAAPLGKKQAGDRLIDTAIVESVTSTPQTLGLALHLQGKFRVPANFVADASLASGRPEPFGFWRDAKVASFHDHAEFDVDYGSLVLHVIVAVPGDFKLWHASTPDVPPRRRESIYLELTTPAKSATFTTTFAPKWQSGK